MINNLSKKIRIDILNMLSKAKASHIGSAYSCVEILIALYKHAKIDKTNPFSLDNDNIILSKGHAVAAQYATLANLGYFEHKQLDSFYQDGSIFNGHVMPKKIPGITFLSMSLGHGCGVGCGIALANKLDNKNNKTYIIIGDGESQEGSVWEMANFASTQKLNNLVAVLDFNNLQALCEYDKISNASLIADKWLSFGWNVIDVKDGHDINQLLSALNMLNRDKPNILIAHTIKGKGVSFMENNILWHYKDPNDNDYKKALEELSI